MEQPKFYEYMIHELRFLSDKKPHKRGEIVEHCAKTMGLTPELMTETIPTGDFIYSNRAGWGLSYLKNAGLVSSPKKAVFVIEKDGLDLLTKGVTRLLPRDLECFPKYMEFKTRKRKTKESTVFTAEEETEPASTPEDLIAEAERTIRETVCSDLLDHVRSMSPSQFERLVVKLLVSMGYGGDFDGSAKTVGGTGDGGIDGVIKQDKLGLDTIYIQAKRYKEGNTVSSHDLRDFVGALLGEEAKGSRKGVFITTSDFSKDGRRYIAGVKDAKVILINGHELVELMYDNGVGVSEGRHIVVKKVDSDFFEE